VAFFGFDLDFDVFDFGMGLKEGIVVRDRSKVQLCDDCLRITIGTEQENTHLVDALIRWQDSVIN